MLVKLVGKIERLYIKSLSLEKVKLKVARDPENLRRINPKHLLNEEIVLLGIRKNGYLYSILPNEMKNNIKVARKAYYQTGKILPYFPESIIEKIANKGKRVTAIGKLKGKENLKVIQEKDGRIIEMKYDSNLKKISEKVILN